MSGVDLDSLQPDDWVAALTLMFAGVAAIAAIVASLITARHERTAWQRDETTRVYRAVQESLEGLVQAVAGSPVDTALHHPAFEGLDEAREIALKRIDAFVEALTHARLFIRPRTLDLVEEVESALFNVTFRACPVRGCVSVAALNQRTVMLAWLGETVRTVTLSMRRDLRIDARWRRLCSVWLVWRSRKRLSEARATLERTQLDQPEATLGAWRVGRWHNGRPQDPDDPAFVAKYDTADYPWANLPITDPYAAQQLAAIAYRVKGFRWMVGVQADLPSSLRELVYQDVVRLITQHGNGAVLPGAAWIATTEGNPAHVWPLDALVAQSADHPTGASS